MRISDDLARIQAEAGEVLNTYGFPRNAVELEQRLTTEDLRDQLGHAAAGVILGLHYMEVERKRGRCDFALERLFDALAAYEDMRLCQLSRADNALLFQGVDKAIKTGFGHIDRLRDMHNSVHGDDETKRERWASLQQMVDDAHAIHPTWSFTQIRDKIAEKMIAGASLASLKRHTKKTW